MLTLDTNLKLNNATTQYAGYDFNSMVNFNGVQLAASENGIFELGGASDDGANIDAYFEPVVSDIGTMHPKRMRYLYIEMRAGGDLTAGISVDGGAQQEFQLEGSAMVPRRYRVAIPRSLHGCYWKYQIRNVNGADFSVDSLNGIFIFRNHGIPQSP
jgi:hypothetical protein